MKDCGCIKKDYFDLKISQRGCKTMIVEDLSLWVKEEGFSIPDTFVATFKSLNNNFIKDIELNSQSFTKLDSKILLDSSKESRIPNDIYCITVNSCKNKLTIHRAYICEFREKLNRLIGKNASSLDEETYKLIKELSFLLEAVEINTELGNINVAVKLFQKLKEKFKNLICEDCY